MSLNWRVNAATLLFFAFIQLVVPLIPRYALTIGASPLLIGMAVSSVSITALMFRPFAGVISDRWSRSYLMILGIVCATFAYLILFISSDIAMITVARLVEGLASAFFIPSSIASAIDHAPEGKLGQTLGWRSLMVGVGMMIGPAMVGFFSEIFSYRPTFIISAVLLLLLIPLVKYK